MLAEVIENLSLKANGIYIDATFGRGGHSKAILAHLGRDGKVIAIDKDEAAIAIGKKYFSHDERISLIQASFAEIGQIATQLGINGQVAGILLDLGVSSPQLDDPARGFSFMQDGPLDMRMDTTKGRPVAEWLATAKEPTLAQVFRDYGEERYAKRIAHAIVARRAMQPITRTLDLASIIAKAHPKWEYGKNPATRCFQALRIFINDELNELHTALINSVQVLCRGGRLAVISFHSLEDRIVKQFVRKQSEAERDFITGQVVKPGKLKKIGKFIEPTGTEINQNQRARSAKLRVMEKVI